ncbi:IS1182 family transposase, partial [Clostridium sp. CX1]|nr:IS1182 family transposase [Clostridium sp. CX1]
ATNKFETKLLEKVKKFIEEINNDFNTVFIIPESKVNLEELKSILELLDKIKLQQNIKFVEGKGRRKTKIQRAVEKIEEFIEKQTKYNDYNTVFDGRNSFSKTDR